MSKRAFLPILALALGHLVTDMQAGALPIVLPQLKEMFRFNQPLVILQINAPCLSFCPSAPPWRGQASPS